MQNEQEKLLGEIMEMLRRADAAQLRLVWYCVKGIDKRNDL